MGKGNVVRCSERTKGLVEIIRIFHKIRKLIEKIRDKGEASNM